MAFRVSLTLAAVGIVGAVLAAAVGLVLLAALPAGSVASTTKLCGKEDTAPAGGKEYLALNNIWGADTAQCVDVGDRSLKVERAEHDRPANGAPAASPALVKGCHFGTCSDNSGLPVQVSRLPAITSDLVGTAGEGGTYNAAYAVWFHSKPAVDGAPDGAEMAIWLRSNGDVRPSGVMVAGAMPIAGASWDVWFEKADGRNRVIYERVGAVTSVEDLDIRAFTKDAQNRGWIKPEWYLIGVEAGFNLWRGGAGNAIDEFSVTVDEPQPAPPTTSKPLGPAACSAQLTIGTTWPEGFTATIVITNSGGRPLTGWEVDWTFPGDQRVQNSWDATITQNGRSVRAVNAAYNGTVEISKTISFGLVGTGTPPKNTPLTCVPR
ncbi:cellulose binding domain-containing protein [Umezawaea sp. Da 62-37]|uniref:cellulose binding domain-containing protein n=1 Tax=Umezawaea sp. Da 62-37 TaxID=3075927 RepID=UPI0028F72808|nr:cellulose binding domain-containing protein [Umezawaea sp. Da 62-37]WNV88887.1 cellulose binding domain-containing protein [Umezawaea sp. Da 62-37]